MVILNVLHLLGAVFIVGPMAVLPMVGLTALRKGNVSMVLSLARTLRWLTYLSLVVAILGFGLVGMADPKYNLTLMTPWVLASIVVYVVAFVITAVVILPQLFKAGRAVPAKDAAKPAGYSALAASSGMTSLLLVIVVVLMVWKP